MLAHRFRVGVSTLRLWRRQAREEGRRAPRRMGGGPAPLGGKLEVLDQLVAERNDAMLAEYANLVASCTGQRTSTPAICRALKQLGWVRKQRRSGLASRTSAFREAKSPGTWQRAEQRGETRLPRSIPRVVFLDESGFDTRLNRAHRRAPRGLCTHGHAPGGHWRRLTLIGALAVDGLCAAMTVAGATNTRVFLAFVTQVLIPALKQGRPNAVVVMDNLAAHKAAVVHQALDQAGIAYRYLPAYSPDMNPIELAWSKLNTYLRARAARTQGALEHAIPEAITTVTPSNAQGWFRHAGYLLN